MLRTTTEEKHTLLVLELLAELLDRLVELEHLFELVGNLAKTLHDLFTPVLLRCSVFTEGESKHDHADELRRIGLCRSNTDLGTGVDVDTAVSEKRNGGTDDVDDTDSQSTALETVAESHERISGLTGLRDEDASIITEHGRLTIEEIGGQLHGNGDLSKFLEDTANCHAGVEGSTASNENQPSAAADGGHVLAETTKRHRLVLDIETTTHGVDDRLWLLEDLLLHKVVEATLHNLLKLNLKSLDGTNVGGAVVLLQTVNVELTLVDVCNIIVLKVQDLLGVFDDRSRVGGEEEFGGLGCAIIREEGTRLRAVKERLVWRSEESAGLSQSNVLLCALSGKSTLLVVLNVNEVDLHLLLCLDTNDKRRTLAGSNDLVGVVDRLDEETKGALELLDDGLDKDGERNVRVLIVDVFGELGDRLSICVGFELEALALQQCLQFLVVGDDPVVDDRKLPVRIRPV